ncbi:hypothetical protein HMPREF0868_1422 [Mageeibacillus indolicus UPII9-5]|uniref:Uncharacterized protein n=1 Tax=Mageeibacillus indolicus (strain UPII9-5) TaxID=699246 RepID=D3QYZ2_MAGIU|nr:hypothetical protein HMPREF0868_1422 [Mageeibacillus indolicus UPII9-5]
MKGVLSTFWKVQLLPKSTAMQNLTLCIAHKKCVRFYACCTKVL